MKRKIFVTFTKILRNVQGKVNYSYVRKILGKNFISPEDVTKIFPNLKFTEKQKNFFVKTLPKKHVISYCYKHDFVLVATPPKELNLLQVIDLKPEDFFSPEREIKWYENESFVKKVKINKLGWLIIAKRYYVGFSKNMECKKLDKRFYAPNITELSWVILALKLFSDFYLFNNFSVLTSTKIYKKGDIIPKNVCIGCFNIDKIRLSYCGINDLVGISFGLKNK